MYQKLTATLCCFMLSCALYAQNGWLPPVSLPGYVCDPSPWKLVFFEDFNGNQLDLSKWKTYTTWDGMYTIRNGDTIAKPDHPHWPDARLSYETALFKDENIVVSGGTCKLLLKNDPGVSWHYVDSTKANHPDSTVVRTLSGATINTPYLKPDGSPNYYNSGKFEGKIKFPTFNGAWCAFWLWQGTSVNELDIAESWGGNGSFWNLWQNRQHTDYAMHAWGPGEDQPNPYGLPGECNITSHYPNQSWWNYVVHNNFDQDNYHTYAYEWDTTSVKVYLDYVLINTIWKYYQDRTIQIWEYKNGQWHSHPFTYRVGSECNPDPGAWTISYGYPYNSNNSQCQLRLNASFDHVSSGLGTTPETKGQMEIDYVKIWQKHPEQDGHTDLCSGSVTPVITGSSVVCGNTVYSVSPVQAGGTWSLSNNAVYFGGGTQSGSTKLIYPNSASPYNNAVLSYTYQPATPGCPPVTVSKTIQTTISLPYITCSRNWNWFTESFTLIASPNLTGATYNWEIDYGINSNNLNHYTGTGPIVHTSSMNHWGIFAYYVKWKLTITTPCGQKVIQGVKNNMSYIAPMLAKASTFREPDSSAWYFETRLTEQDSLNYDGMVHSKVAQLMVADGTDTTEIISFIDKAKAEALEPYLYFEDKASIAMKGGHELSVTQLPESKLYPNPASGNLYIELAISFNKDEVVNIDIHDLMGKLVQSQSVHNASGNVSIDISPIAEGNYILTLRQDKHTEHHKLTKVKRN
jgi:hypothetical protein